MEAFLRKIISPPRRRLHSLLFEERESINHFDQLNFVVTALDDIAISCVFFRNKSANILKEKTDSPRGFFNKFKRILSSKKNYESNETGLKNVVLVYNHSYGSSKYEGSRLLGMCRERGMSLLLYDSRGCGDSEGDFITFGKKEKVDLLYILMKISRDFKYSRFLLWGRSIGCNSVISLLHELEYSRGTALNAVMKNSRKSDLTKKNGAREISRKKTLKRNEKSPYSNIPKKMDNFKRFKTPKKCNFDKQRIMNEENTEEYYSSIGSNNLPILKQRGYFPCKGYNRFFNKVVSNFVLVNPRETAQEILSGKGISQTQFNKRKKTKRKTQINTSMEYNYDSSKRKHINNKMKSSKIFYSNNRNTSIYKSNLVKDNSGSIPQFKIEILGMVLDSPYRSLKSLIKDNAERYLKSTVLGKLSVGPVQGLLATYFDKEIGYDLNSNQNKHLLPQIGSSCFFIISDKDEMIPMKRYSKMIAEYRPTGTKTGTFASLNTNCGHSASRSRKLLRKVFDFVEQKFLEKHVFKYDMKYYEPPKTKLRTGK